MEPIRPDDDELRSDVPTISADRRRAGSKADRGDAGGSGASPKAGGGRQGGGGRGRGALMALALMVVAGLAGAGWYAQEQRIQALEGQLEEADYWARQSKLALARFEGELSETGENLQERGASLAEQIAANKQALEVADSEIRKLWVVANERNKARLDDHQGRLAELETGVAEGAEALTALKASVASVQSSLSADLAALEEQTRTSIASLERSNQQATDQLARLSQQMADVDQLVERRLRRFEQEQKLTLSGMDGRIAALEKASDGLAGEGSVQALRNELASLKRTVQAIDSSRAQLTSRLVRLSEEVNSLRAQSTRN
ncbi:hypothetical protein [Marinobacter qingdaonensis]|uniref:Chromosome partition protein Smc n=1 Tax=Marinobacter qingdaonensis TaxID=3108486 RepID=A0ABU5P0I2_9GAMM|nr:hypothetical protein [Marinobacter sp. ASW11-75]MEA1081492.1 hypothetical protein [Marinobacter sp. ASW11-75]